MLSGPYLSSVGEAHEYARTLAKQFRPGTHDGVQYLRRSGDGHECYCFVVLRFRGASLEATQTFIEVHNSATWARVGNRYEHVRVTLRPGHEASPGVVDECEDSHG